MIHCRMDESTTPMASCNQSRPTMEPMPAASAASTIISAACPLALVSCSTSRYVRASSMSAPRRRSANEADRLEPYGVGCIANLLAFWHGQLGQRPSDHDGE